MELIHRLFVAKYDGENQGRVEKNNLNIHLVRRKDEHRLGQGDLSNEQKVDEQVSGEEDSSFQEQRKTTQEVQGP